MTSSLDAAAHRRGPAKPGGVGAAAAATSAHDRPDGASRRQILVPMRLERVTPGMGRGILISLLPGIILFSLFFVIPLAVVIYTSITDWGPFRFSYSGVANFRQLLGDTAFRDALRNTGWFVAAGLFVQVPVGIALAIILSQHIRGWRILRTIYFLPNVLSYAALALVYVTFFNPRYGVLNQALGWVGIESRRDWLFDVRTSLPAVTLTWVFTAGFIMIIVMAAIAAIPQEIHDAARVDGATPGQITRHITLPLLRNVIGVVTTLVLLFTLAYFDGVYIMTGGGPANRTLTLALYAFQQYSNGNWGYANAICVVILVIGLVAIVGVRRLFRVGKHDL